MDTREQMRQRALYAQRAAGKMDAHVRADEIRQLARDVLTLLDAITDAEHRLAAVQDAINPHLGGISLATSDPEAPARARGFLNCVEMVRVALGGAPTEPRGKR